MWNLGMSYPAKFWVTSIWSWKIAKFLEDPQAKTSNLDCFQTPPHPAYFTTRFFLRMTVLKLVVVLDLCVVFTCASSIGMLWVCYHSIDMSCILIHVEFEYELSSSVLSYKHLELGIVKFRSHFKRSQRHQSSFIKTYIQSKKQETK
jgi:hypothetical protein